MNSRIRASKEDYLCGAKRKTFKERCVIGFGTLDLSSKILQKGDFGGEKLSIRLI